MNSILKPIAALLEKNDQVKSLSFRNMGLNVIPVDLTRFPKLEHLDLSGNEFSILPEQLCALKKLKSINLSSNFRLNWSKSLLVLLDCPKLETLNMSYNGLDALPAELLHFDKLKKLELDGNRLDVFSNRNLMNMPEGIEVLSACHCSNTEFGTRVTSLVALKQIVVNDFEYEELIRLHWRKPEVEVVLL